MLPGVAGVDQFHSEVRRQHIHKTILTQAALHLVAEDYPPLDSVARGKLDDVMRSTSRVTGAHNGHQGRKK